MSTPIPRREGWREERSLRRLRIHEFEALGFTRAEAELLAVKPDVDPVRARALIGAGCPNDVAMRILT
jgi:hypothetical protein